MILWFCIWGRILRSLCCSFVGVCFFKGLRFPAWLHPAVESREVEISTCSSTPSAGLERRSIEAPAPHLTPEVLHLVPGVLWSKGRGRGFTRHAEGGGADSLCQSANGYNALLFGGVRLKIGGVPVTSKLMDVKSTLSAQAGCMLKRLIKLITHVQHLPAFPLLFLPASQNHHICSDCDWQAIWPISHFTLLRRWEGRWLY